MWICYWRRSETGSPFVGSATAPIGEDKVRLWTLYPASKFSGLLERVRDGKKIDPLLYEGTILAWLDDDVRKFGLAFSQVDPLPPVAKQRRDRRPRRGRGVSP